MVAVSAITATLTTLVMGTISDRVGKRKPFIVYGYILWGVSTALFPATASIQTARFAILAVIMADAVMTFFGSTAYDAAYNAWTTDISNKSNRGRLSAVISTFPLLAALIGAGLSGIVIDSLGYVFFFIALGILVSLLGIVGGLLLQDSKALRRTPKGERKNLIVDIFDGFSLYTMKTNQELFLVFSSVALFSIGFQVFLPYQIIYLNNYLNISKSIVGVISALAVLVSILIAVPAGKLADRGYITKLAFFSPLLLTLTITGSLLYISLVIYTLSTGAWMKNLLPEGSRGKFEGIRMVFNVAIPMLIGPAIGSLLVTSFGVPTVLHGESGFIPTPVLFPVAGFISVMAIFPLIVVKKRKHRKKT